MADILQRCDVKQEGLCRKSAHHRKSDGFEAPRNSVEFPNETSQQMPHFINDYIPLLQHKVSYPSKGASMKPPIDDVTSGRSNERTNPPNVVARLMGMDTLASARNAIIDRKESKAPLIGPNVAKRPTASNKIDHNSPTCAPSKQMKCTLLSYNSRRDSTQPHKNRRPTRMPQGDHPQEEQLQKFKKDFEAWQASKVLENSKSLVVDNNIHKGKYVQILAQENLNKVKMAKYIDPKRNSAPKKPLECQTKNDTQCKSDSQDRMDRADEEKFSGHKQFKATKADDKGERTSSPTRIVILKPSFERKVEMETRLGSSEILEEDCSMRDFLEEVKERLKYEIQGKPTSGTTKRGSRTENPYDERSLTPRQIAHDIAKQVRESVVRDIGKKLTRSESMRSYRSDFQINGPDPPVFSERDAKLTLSEKLKNVFTNEISEASYVIKSRVRLKSMPDLSNIQWKEKRTASESEAKHKQDNTLLFNSEAMSPRNLVRSFSAPLSGRIFEKPFLEDRRMRTNSQIQKKHEASKSAPEETKKDRKDSFSIRSRVSNLKQNFTLRGKLFGKKTHSSKKPTGSEFGSMNIIRAKPLAVVNSGITQANNTEVPPSPVSVSYSPRNEISTSENPSPVSPLEVHATENQPSQPRFSKDLTFILPELSQPEQVENNKPGATVADQPRNNIAEIESHEEAYIKDILVAAGLYESRSIDDQANARWKASISNQVFEEVEQAYSRYSKEDCEDSLLHHGNLTIGHKLLFDLVNEAFSSVLNTPKDSSTLRKWVVARATVPHGKRLLDDILDHILIYEDPQIDEMQVINSMLARDVRVATSATNLYENIDVSGKKIECAILGELIDDVVKDMLL